MMKGAVEEESSLACKLRGLYCGQTRTQDHTAFIVFIPLLVVRLFHIFYLESFPAQVSVNEAQPETQIDNYTAGFTPKHLTYGHWPWAEQFRVRI